MQIKFFEILLDFYFIFVYKYPCIGWVAEWLKAHAWKVCLGRKPNASSNLAPSAIKSSLQLKTFLLNPVWIARELVIFCFGCDWGNFAQNLLSEPFGDVPDTVELNKLEGAVSPAKSSEQAFFCISFFTHTSCLCNNTTTCDVVQNIVCAVAVHCHCIARQTTDGQDADDCQYVQHFDYRTTIL